MCLLSIVLVNWNGGDQLFCTLESLDRALISIHTTSEVILVDNASTDGSANEAERRFSRLRVLHSERNLGFGAANNLVFSCACGRYVLIMNPDVLASQVALEALLAFMETHPQAGACGPKILEADNQTISPWCARRDLQPLDVFFEYAYLPRLFSRHRLFSRYTMGDWNHAEDRPVDSLTGACMLVRREVIDQVGGFDEQFFMYGEDIDWCRRMRQHGWQVWFVAAASVRHIGAHSIRQTSDHGARWSIESYIRYFRKWGRPLDLLKVRVALSIGSLVRSVAWLGAACLRPRRWRYALSRSASYLRCSVLAWIA